MILLWLALLNGLFLIPALALPGANPWLSLEALVIWALMCGVNNRNWHGRITLAVAIVLSLLVLLALADALIRESLGRTLNLYLEVRLLGSVWDLMTSNLGPALAFIGILLLLGFLAALVWFSRFALDRVKQHSPAHLGKPLWLVAGLAMAAAVTPWVGSPALAFVANQASLVSHTHQTARNFAEELESRSTTADQTRPLTALAGRDVILGFIESYGISTITDQRYEPVVSKSLDDMAAELARAGLTVATGRLQSPIQGGQSWLGHLSVLSGHWIHNQLAYETLLSSGYSTLIDDFRDTGHQTMAVMPAITRPWPEGRLFRYDRIFDHDNLGYQGPPFNWVTMPDQYTWHRFQTLRAQQKAPLFAELALISSHAPWVPILPVLEDWDTIGDGAVFRQWEGAGEAPVSLWRDAERVREHFARAIAYALETASGFASRYVNGNTLLILLGDHQPAPLITGDNASRDVIVHVISADPALVAPFVDGELPGFRPGIRPDPDTPGALMSALRPFLHKVFGEPHSSP